MRSDPPYELLAVAVSGHGACNPIGGSVGRIGLVCHHRYLDQRGPIYAEAMRSAGCHQDGSRCEGVLGKDDTDVGDLCRTDDSASRPGILSRYIHISRLAFG